MIVIDLGGGTLDVSLLNVQGGMFLTQAMAGTVVLNRLEYIKKTGFLGVLLFQT